MKSKVLLSDRKRVWQALVLLAAAVLLAAGPGFAQGQQKKGGGKGKPPADGQNMSSAGAGVSEDASGNEDAGDEEMLTGEAPNSSAKRPGAAAAKGEEGPVSELSFITRLDKTAVWVGDQFHYQVIVDHAPKIQFVMENVNKDTINMDPLKVMDVTSSSTTLKNGNLRLFVDVILTSYTTGVDKLQIPQLTLFYFRREGAAATVTKAEGAAAESLVIPGPVVGLRSTLPPDPPDLRDAVTVNGWASNRWYVAGIGWVCLFVVVAGAGYEGYHLIRFRRGRKGPDPRKAMAAIQDRWSQYVPGDFNDSNAVMDFYGRSYSDVKEYLSYVLETHTEGLTADDMKAEMGRLAANPEMTERTAKVLAVCETARYGRNGKELIGDPARGVAHDIREIFEAGARLM